MITKDQAIDILDKIEFFQGQRAGRELWLEKSRSVQDDDLANFCANISKLKQYINNQLPQASEVRCAYCDSTANNATTKKHLYVCCCYRLHCDKNKQTITQYYKSEVK